MWLYDIIIYYIYPWYVYIYIIYILWLYVSTAHIGEVHPLTSSSLTIFPTASDMARPVFSRCRGTAPVLQANPLPLALHRWEPSWTMVLSFNLSWGNNPWGALHFRFQENQLCCQWQLWDTMSIATIAIYSLWMPMRWWSPRHREAIQVLLEAWRLSGSAIGVMWW